MLAEWMHVFYELNFVALKSIIKLISSGTWVDIPSSQICLLGKSKKWSCNRKSK